MPLRARAWSQDLGHDSPLTTFQRYGEIAPIRRLGIIRAFGQGKGRTPAPERHAMISRLVEAARRL
jgi:hypothetical protein